MTKAEAHRLLDRACNGEEVSELDILTALRATGDLAPLRVFARDDQGGTEVPIESYAQSRDRLRAPAHLEAA